LGEPLGELVVEHGLVATSNQGSTKKLKQGKGQDQQASSNATCAENTQHRVGALSPNSALMAAR
jgi:hypothetical protein